MSIEIACVCVYACEFCRLPLSGVGVGRCHLCQNMHTEHSSLQLSVETSAARFHLIMLCSGVAVVFFLESVSSTFLKGSTP